MEMIGGTVKFIKVLRMNEILDFFEGLVFVNEKKKKNRKWIFHLEKLNFESIGDSVHTAVYFAWGKVFFSGIYLKLKEYTDLLSVYNLLSLLCNSCWGESGNKTPWSLFFSESMEVHIW